MQHRVDRLQDHVIVAGWGRVGRSIARYARRHGRPVVALEQDGDVVVDEDDVPVIVGDATDEDALMAAGIDRATSLIAALGDSSANLALVLTARSLREDLRIVARIADDRDERKFIRAGADRVVNPYDIGGSRMAAIAFRPHVAEFLDEVVHSEEHDVDIQEVIVAPGSPANGAEIGDVCDAVRDRGEVVSGWLRLRPLHQPPPVGGRRHDRRGCGRPDHAPCDGQPGAVRAARRRGARLTASVTHLRSAAAPSRRGGRRAPRPVRGRRWPASAPPAARRSWRRRPPRWRPGCPSASAPWRRGRRRR